MTATNELVSSISESKQFSTFYIGDRLFGIDVMQVQEVTPSLHVTRIPLAPAFVKGLINLRGQLATTIELRNLFTFKDQPPATMMNVVCRHDGVLLAFLVDRIGDVVEVEDGMFEPTPDTVSEGVRKFMQGVYKTPGQLLSVIEVPKITCFLNTQNEK
ncbi:MAG: chemotaxis protein CheW [Deltaproteobacteria bacterium]